MFFKNGDAVVRNGLDQPPCKVVDHPKDLFLIDIQSRVNKAHGQCNRRQRNLSAMALGYMLAFPQECAVAGADHLQVRPDGHPGIECEVGGTVFGHLAGQQGDAIEIFADQGEVVSVRFGHLLQHEINARDFNITFSLGREVSVQRPPNGFRLIQGNIISCRGSVLRGFERQHGDTSRRFRVVGVVDVEEHLGKGIAGKIAFIRLVNIRRVRAASGEECDHDHNRGGMETSVTHSGLTTL